MKTLRRVNKALGTIVHEVQSFSVHLGTPLDRAHRLVSVGLPDQLPAAVRLLCNAQLKNLEVIFDFEPAFHEEGRCKQACINMQGFKHVYQADEPAAETAFDCNCCTLQNM